jgi:hypothetical protein
MPLYLIAAAAGAIRAESAYTPAVVELVERFTTTTVPAPRIVMVVVFAADTTKPDPRTNSLLDDILDEVEAALSERDVKLRHGDFDDIQLIRRLERNESTPEFVKGEFRQKHTTDNIMWVKCKPRNCDLVVVGRFLGVSSGTYTTVVNQRVPLKALPRQAQPFASELSRCECLRKWRRSCLAVAAIAGFGSAYWAREYDHRLSQLETTHAASRYRSLEAKADRDEWLIYVSATVSAMALVESAIPGAIVDLLPFTVCSVEPWSGSAGAVAAGGTPRGQGTRASPAWRGVRLVVQGLR